MGDHTTTTKGKHGGTNFPLKNGGANCWFYKCGIEITKLRYLKIKIAVKSIIIDEGMNSGVLHPERK